LGLEKAGRYTIKICSSGEEAIREIPGFLPDILILDVVMPDMTGPQTLEIMQNMPGMPRVPVIFMTSKTQPMQLEHYKKLGALGVIRKPLNPMNLAALVEDIWEKECTMK
jgi:CheY-like chemotaxis protein